MKSVADTQNAWGESKSPFETKVEGHACPSTTILCSCHWSSLDVQYENQRLGVGGSVFHIWVSYVLAQLEKPIPQLHLSHKAASPSEGDQNSPKNSLHSEWLYKKDFSLRDLIEAVLYIIINLVFFPVTSL